MAELTPWRRFGVKALTVAMMTKAYNAPVERVKCMKDFAFIHF